MSSFASLGLHADQDVDLRTRAFARLRTGDLPGCERDLTDLARRSEGRPDAHLVHQGGLAELELARGHVTSALISYRAALNRADWDEPSTTLWRLLLGAGCLHAHLEADDAASPGLRALAERLRAHVLRLHRAWPDNVDLALLGSVAAVYALWFAAQPGSEDERSGRLWSAAWLLGPRQDLPTLERSRLAGTGHRLGLAETPPPTSRSEPAGADGGAGPPAPAELVDRVLSELERP